VTDRALARRPLEEVVEAVVARGVDWVQVREKDLAGRELLELSERVARAAHCGGRRRTASATRVRVVVNRHTDVALALERGTDAADEARLDGVHLGFDAARPADARRLLGPHAWIGLSCHTPAEALAEGETGASYLQLAPVFAPLSKAAQAPPLGIPALAAAARCGLPILAQGGIAAQNAAAAVAAGAAGVAVTGAILMASDPGEAAGALRRALDAAWPGLSLAS